MEKVKSWFPAPVYNGQVLEAGIYKAKFKEVVPGTGKAYGSNEVRHTLMFSFLEETTGAVINKTVTASLNEQSGLVALARQMAGSRTPRREVLQGPDSLQAYITAMIGKDFNLQVEPSSCGRFTNLVTCSPAMEW